MDRPVVGFDKSFAKAGACTGVREDCFAVATSCPTALQGLLPATGAKCVATRIKAAGKLVTSLTSCYAKSKTAAVANCVLETTAKFRKSYDKVTGCAGDGQTESVLAGAIDACVTPVATTDETGAILTLCPPAPSCGEPSVSDTCFDCSISPECKLSCLCANSGTDPTACALLGPEWPGCVTSEVQLPCEGHIENCNGNLTCPTPPAGSYPGTCFYCSVSCDGLTCFCIDDAGTCGAHGTCPKSTLPLPCVGSILNCHGQLACSPDGECPGD
jgi:hypothetical protein